ncbi:hypothetical protein HMPREF9065_00837 [Aggregatibacter sp. oral taxon 458 str. W10330]|nr:hypothetical protein HMPREF9065_00837 [Aggregatibacter sp. oral taxon 458 str. W10330]
MSEIGVVIIPSFFAFHFLILALDKKSAVEIYINFQPHFRDSDENKLFRCF